MIWLGYENIGDKSEWISTSELTHTANLVSNFHIAYVKIEESGLDLFYFSFHFYFLFDVFFYFLFLEQLGLELISHAVTSVIT